MVLGVDGERLGSQQILQDPCILVRTSPEQLLGHDEHLAAEHRVEVAKQRIRSTLAREALATEDPTHEVLKNNTFTRTFLRYQHRRRIELLPRHLHDLRQAVEEELTVLTVADA